MDFQEFQDKAKDRVRKLAEQNPKAIIRFGSSLNERDYVSGISDLDLIVVSEHPIERTWVTSPREFVIGILTGDPFLISAFRRGLVEHDPEGYIAKLKDDPDANELVVPRDRTLDYALTGVNNQMGSAATRYFHPTQEWGAKSPVIRNAYSAAQALARSFLFAFNQVLGEGYSDIVQKLSADGDKISQRVLKILQEAREIAEHHKDVDDRRPQNPIYIGRNLSYGRGIPLIEDKNDTIGQLVTKVETTYSRLMFPFAVSCPVTTNELIEDNYHASGGVERVIAVRRVPQNREFYILGERGGRDVLFGVKHPDELYPNAVPKNPEKLRTEMFAAVR